MKSVVTVVVALGLGLVGCNTKDTSLGSGSTGGGKGAMGGSSGSGGILGSGGGVGSGGALGSGGIAGAAGADAGVSQDATDAASSDVAPPACACGALCNSCPPSAPQCPGAIAYCDPSGACVIGGPPVCPGGNGGAGGAGGAQGQSCATVNDCGPNPAASCAGTCPDGSNPCPYACRSNQCVPRGCPSGAGGGAGGGSAFACGAGGAGGASSLSCLGGQTFCHVENMKVGPATLDCRSFTDAQRIADCSATPTCACLCGNALFFSCQTECRCNETNGHVTVTCDQI